MIMLNNSITIPCHTVSRALILIWRTKGRKAISDLVRSTRVAWLVLVWTLCFSIPTHADPPLIKLATLNWQPYVSEELDGGGFATEIVRLAFEKAGYRTEITSMPWIRVLAEVKKGAFDAMYPAYYSDSRSKNYALSASIANSPLALCKRSDRALIYRSLEDLRPYIVGVVRGYVNTAAFDRADFITKKIVNSDKQNLLKVLTGRIDLAVIDMYTAQHIIDTSIPQARGKLDFMMPPLDVKPLYVGFSKARPGYHKRLEAFNQALNELKQAGIVAKIYTRHGFHIFQTYRKSP
jgi:polar amino acid transport system substrate-binding protein